MFEIEYEEKIEKIINKDAVEIFINDLKETYREEFGWKILNFETTPLNNTDVKVSVIIEKYRTEQKTR